MFRIIVLPNDEIMSNEFGCIRLNLITQKTQKVCVPAAMAAIRDQAITELPPRWTYDVVALGNELFFPPL